MVIIYKKGMTPYQASNIKVSKGLGITNLEKMRVKRNLSQKELSNLSGLSLRRIQSYEQRTRNVDGSCIATLLNLCIALKCNIEDIIEEEANIDKLKQVINAEYPNNDLFSHENRYEEQKELYLKLFVNGNFTKDQKDGLDFLMKKVSVLWKKALKLRFEKEMTYEQIGDELEISKARVSQIIDKALRRLEEIESSDYVVYGLNTCMAMEEEQRKNRSIDDISISELNLGGRAYNCLMRSGLDTIGKIIKIKRDELLIIKHMNESSADEVLSKLNEFKENI